MKQAKQVAQLEDDTQQVKASLCEDFNLHQSNERKIQFTKCELMKKVAWKEIEELAKGNAEEPAQHAKNGPRLPMLGFSFINSLAITLDGPHLSPCLSHCGVVSEGLIGLVGDLYDSPERQEKEGASEPINWENRVCVRFFIVVIIEEKSKVAGKSLNAALLPDAVKVGADLEGFLVVVRSSHVAVWFSNMVVLSSHGGCSVSTLLLSYTKCINSLNGLS
ncbi:hypothetical protein MA16_Dca025132 [Dendrobium catenatum]|uniref:Uncharacterized protein n=1 Tax=Dendrobium catenatum TaxID=906689 RepID=A0A2I0VA61_9ASPA|nr:hypothetical protein MA16_Dca025132 [Dendrobium catenatum]